jgi:hypothetical protein
MDLITTSDEFATVEKALAIFENSYGPYAFRLCMRPHRKACIVNYLMRDHQGMTLECANAVADEWSNDQFPASSLVAPGSSERGAG